MELCPNNNYICRISTKLFYVELDSDISFYAHTLLIPQFIGGAIDGATKGVREKLKLILKAIASNESKRIPFYKEVAKLDDSDRTLERYIQQLREADLIEFRGDASQTGGYYLTEDLKDKLMLYAALILKIENVSNLPF